MTQQTEVPPEQLQISQTNEIMGKTLTLVAVILPLAATVFAITKLWQREVTGTDLALMLGLYLLTGLGITVGFHRYATHRSFKSNPITEFVLLALGSMAVEGNVITWVATHCKHHRLSDKPGDPHSPLEGLFHAHIGWMFHPEVQGSPEIDAKHLLKDPIAKFINKTFVLWVALGLVIPFAIDGWRGLLWGGLVRICLTHHITWAVNSVCHQFGRRIRDRGQDRNEWFVGLFGLGEGWHNNHHAFPESAFHGLKWYQIDLSGYVIRGMERLHFITDVRRVSRVGWKSVWKPQIRSWPIRRQLIRSPERVTTRATAGGRLFDSASGGRLSD